MSHLLTLTRYNEWANGRMFSAIASLPQGEAAKGRRTHFGSMIHTLNHLYVIECIFQAHLQGRPHQFTARNTPTHPPLRELTQAMKTIDRWYIDYAGALSGKAAAQRVRFSFVDGGEGIMTRAEIVAHVVNHGSYHRGMVAGMMYEVPATPPVTDLTVFLRDAAQA